MDGTGYENMQNWYYEQRGWDANGIPTKKILEKLIQSLHIEPGETTSDRRFSLETVRCLGACGLAPTVVIDGDNFPQVKPAGISEILSNYQ